MNKWIKTIVISLAVVIVGMGIFIPVMASQTAEPVQAEAQVAENAEMTEEEALVEEAMGDGTEIATAEDSSKGSKALAAAVAVGLAAAAGAIGMGVAIAKSVEGVARQPEASGKIQTMLMLGLVFIETAIIYALIVAILIIFVL